MRKIKLYIAMSLNGMIAAKDGNIDWLNSIPNPDKTDYGYSEFINSIDTTIMGYNTFRQLIDWGIEWPYPDKKNYVITGKKNVENTSHVSFISENHTGWISQLKKQEGKDIWLIGGGQVNALLLNAGLIDLIQVFIMPVIIPEGIGLLSLISDPVSLRLTDFKTHSSGAAEITYSLEKNLG